MKLYLDTADQNEISELMSWGVFSGITTNPVILRNSQMPKLEVAKKLAPIFRGDFFIQTWGQNSDEMVKNALYYFNQIGERLVVKVPSTTEGLKTISQLAAKKIRAAATALFTPGQAILATEAGAEFVIPFYSRIEKDGKDAVEIVKQIVSNSRNKNKVLVASLKTVEHVVKLIACNIDSVTIPPILAKEMIKSDLTDSAMTAFNESSSEKEE